MGAENTAEIKLVLVPYLFGHILYIDPGSAGPHDFHGLFHPQPGKAAVKGLAAVFAYQLA